MNEIKIKEFQAEIGGAMGRLNSILAEGQKTLGILESFLYLLRKEYESKDSSLNGVVKEEK